MELISTSPVRHPHAESKPRVNILLVDDNPANLLALRAILDDLGHNLVEVRSGEEALVTLESEDFAVVLLDVFMPGIDGFETAKRIRAQQKRTPIIFLTANDIPRSQLELGYAFGAVDFLVKPLVPTILRVKVMGFVELFQDKQMARREADQFRLLIEGTKDYAIFLLDPQGYVASWNAGAERIKQYRAKEIIGQHFSRFYPQEAVDRGWPDRELELARAEGRFEDEGWRVRKDGTRIWANVVITALYDGAGALQGFSKITRDMTERMQAEVNARRLADEEIARVAAEENARLLQDINRRKDEFLATLAHELRNPLAPIRNSLQILRMPNVDPDTTRQTLEMMERQVHHLVRLVDDLLDVSRVTRCKIELRKEPIDLATVVARAMETVQPLIEEQGHRLDLSLGTDPLILDADPVRLAQVVGNLLTNAAKYTEPNGQIWVSASRRGDFAVLRIRDDGIGIAPEMLDKVFDLFTQVDYTSPHAQGGLGIGLTLVKNLVEMHHGAVKVHSAGLGRGSEFEVRLPLAVATGAGAPPECEPKPKPATVFSGHRLLVVDDNKDAALSLVMLLRLQGHEVQIAHNGASALDVARSYRPDMVFLDIGMPGMDGYEVARQLRKTAGLENTILTALTGWGQEQDKSRTAEAGFEFHLVKPPEPKAVNQLLNDITLRKRAAAVPRRVLVVEDNVGAATILSMLIRKIGPHEVATACDGPAAIEMAGKFQPDIILLDIGLPQMDGYTVARRLREIDAGRDALLVALTGYGQDEDRLKSSRAGFDEHFVKPISVDVLRQLLCHAKLESKDCQ